MDCIDFHASSSVKQECLSNRGLLRWSRFERPRNPNSPQPQRRFEWRYTPFELPGSYGKVTVRMGDEKPTETIWQRYGVEVGESQQKTA